MCLIIKYLISFECWIAKYQKFYSFLIRCLSISNKQINTNIAQYCVNLICDITTLILLELCFETKIKFDAVCKIIYVFKFTPNYLSTKDSIWSFRTFISHFVVYSHYSIKDTLFNFVSILKVYVIFYFLLHFM